MNEIGLDPGIDHLYAVKTIDEVHAQGGKVFFHRFEDVTVKEMSRFGSRLSNFTLTVEASLPLKRPITLLDTNSLGPHVEYSSLYSTTPPG